MRHHCTDCGTRFTDGLCPNCHETALIFETQFDYLPDNLSEEFINEAAEQRNKAQKQIKGEA